MTSAGAQEPRRLTGRVAIVTGGAGGIGLATAVAFAREGALVALGDSDEARLVEAAAAVAAVSSATLHFVVDVRSEADLAEMVAGVLAGFGRVDILVAAAGILRAAPPKPVAQMSVASWDAVIDTNLKGVFLTNRAVLPTMITQRSGHVINISSTFGREGRALDSAYCASKAGVIGLSEAAAQEVSRYGVSINTVLPGAVDTPLWEQNAPIPKPEDILPPERVAELILYLVTMPDEVLLLEPVLVPFRALRPRRR